MASALRFTGLFYLFVTVYIAFFKKEEVVRAEEKKTDSSSKSDIIPIQKAVHFSSSSSDVNSSRSVMFDSIRSTYSELLVVTRKPAVRSLVLALLVAKVGFSAYDNGMCRTLFPLRLNSY